MIKKQKDAAAAALIRVRDMDEDAPDWAVEVCAAGLSLVADSCPPKPIAGLGVISAATTVVWPGLLTTGGVAVGSNAVVVTGGGSILVANPDIHN